MKRVVILRTRCGCERRAAVDDHAAVFRVAIHPKVRLVDAPLAASPETRDFVWIGEHRDGVQVWEEC